MAEDNPKSRQKPRLFAFNEDWLATIIGLLFVAIIGAGVIGPGPQKVTLRAAARETDDVSALPIAGWSINATVGDLKVGTSHLPDTLAENRVYLFTCDNGSISVIVTEGTIENGNVLLSLDNNCDDEVTITYKTGGAIPWPLFGILD